MALDGITISAIVSELKAALLGGRIDKIHQPLRMKFVCQFVGLAAAAKKIIISANSAHPRIHLTESSRENPMAAPLFCMVMRKHIAGGKIIDIVQPNFERIIILRIESANEMGDITTKNLILEIMGKHSNLILTDETGKILDSIKRVTHEKALSERYSPARNMFSPLRRIRKTPSLPNRRISSFPCICRRAEGCRNFFIKPTPASALSWQAKSAPAQGWMLRIPVRKPRWKTVNGSLPPSRKPCRRSKRRTSALPFIIRRKIIALSILPF